MSYNEMINRAKEMTLEELENANFMNEMIDRWSPEDYTWSRVLHDEIRSRKAKGEA